MNDDLKEQLLQQVNHIDDLVTEIGYQVDEDESIPDEKWKVYDKQIRLIFVALNHLKEDIHFT